MARLSRQLAAPESRRGAGRRRRRRLADGPRGLSALLLILLVVQAGLPAGDHLLAITGLVLHEISHALGLDETGVRHLGWLATSPPHGINAAM